MTAATFAVVVAVVAGIPVGALVAVVVIAQQQQQQHTLVVVVAVGALDAVARSKPYL